MAAVCVLFFSLLIYRVSAKPSLTLNLALPSSAVKVEHLAVKATLTNTGDVSLKLFNDPRSILFKDKTTKFLIKSKSCTPYFTGLSIIYELSEAVKSANPLDFTVLKPDQTFEFKYHLVDTYDFSHCGEDPYQIEAFKTFYYVDELGELKAIEASTKSGSFKVEKARKPISHSRRAGDSGIGELSPYTSGCDSTQRSLIIETATSANKMVEYALKELSDASSGGNPRRYEIWFGEYHRPRLDIVQSHFKQIENKATHFKYDCFLCQTDFQGKSWMLGYVETARKSNNILYVCPGLWKMRGDSKRSRAGVFVRALLQLLEDGDITDDYTTSKEVQALASKNPTEAIMNAENHRYFAEALMGTLRHHFAMEEGTHTENFDEKELEATSSLPVTTTHTRRRPVATPPPSASSKDRKGKAKVHFNVRSI